MILSVLLDLIFGKPQLSVEMENVIWLDELNTLFNWLSGKYDVIVD